jgi:hypothetical protein
MLEKDSRILVLVPVAVAMIASSWIGARSWERVKTRTVRTIEVTGSAKRRITSDLVEWQARIETRNADLTASYRELHADVDKTIAYLKAQGLTDAEISVSSVTREELTDTEVVGSGEDRIEKKIPKGFLTTQSIVVTSKDVSKVEKISREATSLIDQGVPIDSLPPAYYYTKLGDVKIEMLAEASKDARARADRMVASADGKRTLKLSKADMGVINVNPANSTDTSWEGNNDTSSLDKDIITIVHVTFDLR